MTTLNAGQMQTYGFIRALSKVAIDPVSKMALGYEEEVFHAGGAETPFAIMPPLLEPLRLDMDHLTSGILTQVIEKNLPAGFQVDVFKDELDKQSAKQAWRRLTHAQPIIRFFTTNFLLKTHSGVRVKQLIEIALKHPRPRSPKEPCVWHVDDLQLLGSFAARAKSAILASSPAKGIEVYFSKEDDQTSQPDEGGATIISFSDFAERPKDPTKK